MGLSEDDLKFGGQGVEELMHTQWLLLDVRLHNAAYAECRHHHP